MNPRKPMTDNDPTTVLLDPMNATVLQLFRAMRAMNAGILKITVPHADGETPLGAIILLDGQDTTEPMLEAIAAEEARWEKER